VVTDYCRTEVQSIMRRKVWSGGTCIVRGTVRRIVCLLEDVETENFTLFGDLII